MEYFDPNFYIAQMEAMETTHNMKIMNKHLLARYAVERYAREHPEQAQEYERQRTPKKQPRKRGR